MINIAVPEIQPERDSFNSRQKAGAPSKRRGDSRGSLRGYKPLAAQKKFEIARQDSFDGGTVILAAAFAVDAQHTKADPSFGQAVADAAAKLGMQIGVDMASNVLKEFWPEISRESTKYGH